MEKVEQLCVVYFCSRSQKGLSMPLSSRVLTWLSCPIACSAAGAAVDAGPGALTFLIIVNVVPVLVFTLIHDAAAA